MHIKWAAVIVTLSLAWPLWAADAKAPWVGNTLGHEALSPDHVDPNHPPLDLQGQTVSAGFKRLTIGESGLPRTVSWRDSQMLRAPVRLMAGDNQDVSLQGKIQKAGANAVQARMEGVVDGLRYVITADFDFDFTIRYTLTVSPVDRPVELDRLAVVFPVNVTLGDEKLLLYYAEGPSKNESGEEAQARRVHRTIKADHREVIAPGFCSLWWVGTTQWGLSLNFESARHWAAAPGQEIVFDTATGDLALNFIGRQTRIDSERTYKFFLTPTPVRTMPKSWRAWNYGWRGSPQVAIPPTVNQLIYWSSTFRFEGSEMFNNHWLRNPDELAAVAAKDAPMRKAAYFIPQLVTPRIFWEGLDGQPYLMEDPHLLELAKQYQRTPGNKGRDLAIPDNTVRFKSVQEYAQRLGRGYIANNKIKLTHDNRDVIFVPELADHMVWGMQKMIDLGVGGIYFDGINPQQNYSDWAAWTDDAGNKRPFFHFEELRQLMKRMRHLVKHNDPDETIVAHQSGTRPGATLSLCDAIIPGETFFYWYQPPEKRDASPNGDFYYAHIVGDIDNLKGEFFHRQWGVPHILLPEVRGKNRQIFPDAARGTRTMLAYTQHFDMLYFPTMCDVREIYKLYAIRDAYGMADTAQYVVDFTPYWENKLFDSGHAQIKVSYYDHVKEHELYSEFDHSRKFLVIVSNLQFDDATFKLKLPANLQNAMVKDMQTGQTIPVKDGHVEHALIAYDFALLEVTGEMR